MCLFSLQINLSLQHSMYSTHRLACVRHRLVLFAVHVSCVSLPANHDLIATRPSSWETNGRRYQHHTSTRVSGDCLLALTDLSLLQIVCSASPWHVNSWPIIGMTRDSCGLLSRMQMWSVAWAWVCPVRYKEATMYGWMVDWIIGWLVKWMDRWLVGWSANSVEDSVLNPMHWHTSCLNLLNLNQTQSILAQQNPNHSNAIRLTITQSQPNSNAIHLTTTQSQPNSNAIHLTTRQFQPNFNTLHVLPKQCQNQTKIQIQSYNTTSTKL